VRFFPLSYAIQLSLQLSFPPLLSFSLSIMSTMTITTNNNFQLSTLFNVIESVLQDELQNFTTSSSSSSISPSSSSSSSPSPSSSSSSPLGLDISCVQQLLQEPLSSSFIWSWHHPVNSSSFCSSSSSSFSSSSSSLSYSLPMRPYYKEVGHVLHLWSTTKQYPLQNMPSLPLLQEVPEVLPSFLPSFSFLSHLPLFPPLLFSSYQKLDRITKIAPQVEALSSHWSSNQKLIFQEMKEEIRGILQILGVRGILTLLRLRHTVGSAEVFPVG
jgi:hypothetical protein